MVLTPAPGMAKVIVSAPAVELAEAIAARSEPAPPLLTLVTLKVAGARRSSRPSTRGRSARGCGVGRGDGKRGDRQRRKPERVISTFLLLGVEVGAASVSGVAAGCQYVTP